jgi:hypothetical protein
MRIHTKTPWYEMYPRDFLYNTRSMDATEKGILVELSNYYWINICVPINTLEVDRIIKGLKVRKKKFIDFKKKYPEYFINDEFISPELDSAYEKLKQESVNGKQMNKTKALKKKEKENLKEAYTDTHTDTNSHTYKHTESNTDTYTNTDTSTKYPVSKLFEDHPSMKNYYNK